MAYAHMVKKSVSVAFCRGSAVKRKISRVESKKSRVEGIMSRVEAKMSSN